MPLQQQATCLAENDRSVSWATSLSTLPCSSISACAAGNTGQPIRLRAEAGRRKKVWQRTGKSTAEQGSGMPQPAFPTTGWPHSDRWSTSLPCSWAQPVPYSAKSEESKQIVSDSTRYPIRPTCPLSVLTLSSSIHLQWNSLPTRTMSISGTVSDLETLLDYRQSDKPTPAF